MRYVRQRNGPTPAQLLEEHQRIKLAHQQLREDFYARDVERSAPAKKTRKRARAGLR